MVGRKWRKTGSGHDSGARHIFREVTEHKQDKHKDPGNEEEKEHMVIRSGTASFTPTVDAY